MVLPSLGCLLQSTISQLPSLRWTTFLESATPGLYSFHTSKGSWEPFSNYKYINIYKYINFLKKKNCEKKKIMGKYKSKNTV
ncbi:hypothetical protein E2320_012224 [Naja naja]|nr:hypothetical protein E2320_012224 [Naja naja]